MIKEMQRLGSFATAVLMFAFTGCRDDRIEDAYGSHGAVGDRVSVNGTSVLRKLFEQAGCTVTPRWRLSPRVERNSDAVIWFANDFQSPTYEPRQWLETFLQYDPNRLVVYIGRDFSASPGYWRAAAAKATGAQRAEMLNRAAEAESNHDVFRGAESTSDGDWYAVSPGTLYQQPGDLTGPWSEGVDAAKTKLLVRDVLSPATPSEFEEPTILLDSDLGPLVGYAELDYADPQQCLIVANGSFLLNLPLVNRENRKLAMRFVQEVVGGKSGPRRRITFLESGPGGPPVLSEDPQVSAPTGLEMFAARSIGFVLLHLAAFGLVYSFMRAPIFGAPRQGSRPSLRDFGAHLDAVGGLLQRTDDLNFAQRLVNRRRRRPRSVINES